LGKATSTLEGEEVKNQIKQFLENIEDNRKRKEKKYYITKFY